MADETRKGVRPISKAPEPISPVRGGRSTYAPVTKTPGTPDWAIWANIPNCRVWQAVCLSLDIDPDDSHPAISTWLEYGNRVPHGLPAAVTARLQVALGNLGGKIRVLDGGAGTQYSLVRITEVAALFESIDGWSFPSGLGRAAKQSQRERELDAMSVPGAGGLISQLYRR